MHKKSLLSPGRSENRTSQTCSGWRVGDPFSGDRSGICLRSKTVEARGTASSRGERSRIHCGPDPESRNLGIGSGCKGCVFDFLRPMGWPPAGKVNDQRPPENKLSNSKKKLIQFHLSFLA
jgi:hypothetical protein